MESLSNKVAGLKAGKFIEKRLQHRRFLVNIAKFSKIPVLKKQVKFAADIYKKDC